MFVIADGTTINGSELVAGLNDFISQKIPIIGGLAGWEMLDSTVGLNAVRTEGTWWFDFTAKVISFTAHWVDGMSLVPSKKNYPVRSKHFYMNRRQECA